MSVQIKTRTTKTRQPRTGRFQRYYVYYRLGGRSHREFFAGSFETKGEAQTRRDLVAGEIAAGRDPGILLTMLRRAPVQAAGLGSAWDVWAASKRKVGVSAKALYGNSKTRWVTALGEHTDPEALTVPQIAAGVDALLEDLSPATVRLYLSHLAMMLDFTLPDGTPNPARSRKLELPAATGEKQPPPSNTEWAAILMKIPARSRLAVRLMECCGLRVSEACSIEPGDIDLPGGQILIRRTKTRAGRRWLPTPPALLDDLFGRGGVGVSSAQVYYDVQQACEKAKIRDFGTHAFRRRRISLWFAQQIDAPQIARWAGHAKASESMDTYAFEVMDALTDEWFSWWQDAYRGVSRDREETVQ